MFSLLRKRKWLPPSCEAKLDTGQIQVEENYEEYNTTRGVAKHRVFQARATHRVSPGSEHARASRIGGAEMGQRDATSMLFGVRNLPFDNSKKDFALAKVKKTENES